MKTTTIKLENFPGNLNPEIEVICTDKNRVRCTFSSLLTLTGKYHCFPFRATKELKNIREIPGGYKTYFEMRGFSVREIKMYEG